MIRTVKLVVTCAPLLLCGLTGCGDTTEVVEVGELEKGQATGSPLKALVQAQELALAGSLDEALALLEAENAAHPDDDDVLVALSRLHRLRDEIPAAERLLRAGLRSRPSAGALAVELAEVYLSLHRADRAVETLLAARRAGAGDGDDLAYRLGVSLAHVERHAEAAEELARAEAAGSDPVSVGYSLAMLLVHGRRWAEAGERLEGLLLLEPGRPDLVRELGRVRLALHPEDLDVARSVFADVDAVIEQNPEDWFAYEILGDAQMVMGDPDAALYLYVEALKYGQNPPRVEDKYRRAVMASRAAARAAGIEPPELPTAPPQTRPPLPASIEHLEGFWSKTTGPTDR